MPHRSAPQQVIGVATRQAGPPARPSFQFSFPLLITPASENPYDLNTALNPLGHKHPCTTPVRTHAMTTGRGAVRSPADRLLAPLAPSLRGQGAPFRMVLDCRDPQSSTATPESDESL